MRADFEVRKFHAGEMFGHQEVVEHGLQTLYEQENPGESKKGPINRKSRVVTLEDCELYYVNSVNFNDINCK